MRPRAVSSLRLKRVLSGRQIALCSDGGPDEDVSCQAQERDILDAVICAADEADAQRLVNEEGCKIEEIHADVAHVIGTPQERGRHDGVVTRWMLYPTTLLLATLVASSPALAGTYTTSGERTPAEIQRNVRECLERLQSEPLAGEICNAEQNLAGNPASYKPRYKKAFAACLKALPRGKYAAQSRAICADNDVTNCGHPASGNLGHFEIRE